jgi:MFS family permease
MLIAGFANGFCVYLVTLALMATWASLYHPLSNAFISKAFKVKAPEAMGIHGVGGTLGVVLTPVTAGLLARASICLVLLSLLLVPICILGIVIFITRCTVSHFTRISLH